MKELLHIDEGHFTLNDEQFENAYALLWAYKDNNDDEVERLLSIEASPNALDEQYYTTLHVACINNDVEMVKKLIENEKLITLFRILNPFPKYWDNIPAIIIRKSALYQKWTVILGTGEETKTAFFCACESNAFDVLQVFLEEFKNSFGNGFYHNARYYFRNEKLINCRANFSEEVQTFLSEFFNEQSEYQS